MVGAMVESTHVWPWPHETTLYCITPSVHQSPHFCSDWQQLSRVSCRGLSHYPMSDPLTGQTRYWTCDLLHPKQMFYHGATPLQVVCRCRYFAHLQGGICRSYWKPNLLVQCNEVIPDRIDEGSFFCSCIGITFPFLFHLLRAVVLALTHCCPNAGKAAKHLSGSWFSVLAKI